jgi:hypothetical protein
MAVKQHRIFIGLLNNLTGNYVVYFYFIAGIVRKNNVRSALRRLSKGILCFGCERRKKGCDNKK